MSSRRRILLALTPAALALPVLAGCGGGDEPASATAPAVTRTVTVTTTPAPPASTDTTQAAPPAPAPLTLHAAEQILSARGYTALGERDWRPDQTLKVLLGISNDDGPRAELAFFFAGDEYIGTDAKDPSGAIEVAAQREDAIALSYALYRPSDAIDRPTGGTAEVTFRWDGSQLTPQDPIPPASPDAPLSRR